MTKEFPITKSQKLATRRPLCHSSFGFLSPFDIRHSSFARRGASFEGSPIGEIHKKDPHARYNALDCTCCAILNFPGVRTAHQVTELVHDLIGLASEDSECVLRSFSATPLFAVLNQPVGEGTAVPLRFAVVQAYTAV